MHDVSDGQRRRLFQTRYMLYGLCIVLLGIGVPYGWQLWQYYQTHESTDDAYVVSDIVPLSPQVNGTVLAVHVVDNQTVDANHILAQLDRAILRRASNKWKPPWLWRLPTCVGPRSRCS
jgi:multidrug resistance efflux pump